MVRNRTTTEDDITAEVIRRIEKTEDARLREIMLSLVRHLHAFVKEVQLNEKEWWQGIQFLTRAGHMCSEKRQEFILLSDTLGVSMVVDLISNRKRDGATESTVFGPFHREGAPEMPLGANIAPHDPNGIPTIVSGRVLGLEGEPISGALLDVWQTDSSGKYDAQYPGGRPGRTNARGHGPASVASGAYSLRGVGRGL
jgi:protocatechuate 3,4-dioxygenase beta subunit